MFKTHEPFFVPVVIFPLVSEPQFPPLARRIQQPTRPSFKHTSRIVGNALFLYKLLNAAVSDRERLLSTPVGVPADVYELG